MPYGQPVGAVQERKARHAPELALLIPIVGIRDALDVSSTSGQSAAPWTLVQVRHLS